MSQAYMVIVHATVGVGRITGIDAVPVMWLPGVIAIIDHRNAPRLAYREHKAGIDPAIGERLHVCKTTECAFAVNPSRSSSPRRSTKLNMPPPRCA
ncbi:MAG TPA: hypothetical protein VME41_17310 [Stellaceae bacterium]|nr:hypothetical protein [Stellaceae bacterium]